MRRLIWLTALLVALVFISGCIPSDTIRQTERLDYRGNIREFSIQTYNGAVVWKTLPRDRAPYVIIDRHVTGLNRPAMESYLRNMDVRERVVGNVVTLSAEEYSRPQGVTSSGVKITVYASPQDIHEFHAVTRNSIVQVEQFLGMLRVETSNGRIEIMEGSGIVDLRTSNAPVDLGTVVLEGDSRVRSSNGRISGNVTISRGRNFSFHTANANIDLFFPTRMRGVFDMQTSNGRINIELTEQSGSSRNQLVVGRGDPFISLRTSNGNITVLPQRTATRTVR